MEYIDIKENAPYFNLEIASTPNCNMACSYCFEGDELKSKSKQTLENIDKIIDKMEALLTDPKFFLEYKGICLNFWGGEPTINYEWNKTLFLAIKDKPWYEVCTFFIYSNGFDFKKVQKHIDLFSAEELVKDKLRLQISWDGVPGERIDHKGNQTFATIEKNIKNLALVYPTLNLKIKATIQPQELIILKSIWSKFYDLHLWVTRKAPAAKLQINFSPTLNYIDDFIVGPEYLAKIKKSFVEVASLELEFFREYKRHLFAWFDSSSAEDFLAKRKTNCSAGINILAFDIEGNTSACHGTLYSPLKKDFIAYNDMNLNTPNEEFKMKFYSSREKLKNVHGRFDPGCEGCTATVCYKCPIINVEQKYKETINAQTPEQSIDTPGITPEQIVEAFQDRDPRHCDIYKLFGIIDRSLYKLKISQQLIEGPTDGKYPLL